MRVFTYTATAQDEGRQIKRVIRGAMGLSYHQFALLKVTGGMLLDGAPVHANQVVQAGQVIQARLAEAGGLAQPRPGPVHILYQDEDVLVVNKQAPLPCQSSSRQQGDALENYLAHYFLDQQPYTFRPVNRLDKGTSGLMAVARNAHAQMILAKDLHTDSFHREYRALVVGTPPKVRDMIALPIRKADGATVRREVHPLGKPAQTYYEVLAGDGQLTLLRLVLATGRTHQIRVHMASIGCPVLGDFLYGQEDPRLEGRFALHSAHMRFNHPITGAPLSFDAPLPPDMAALCPTKPT